MLKIALRSHRCSPVAPVGAFAAAATVVVVRVWGGGVSSNRALDTALDRAARRGVRERRPSVSPELCPEIGSEIGSTSSRA